MNETQNIDFGYVTDEEVEIVKESLTETYKAWKDESSDVITPTEDEHLLRALIGLEENRIVSHQDSDALFDAIEEVLEQYETDYERDTSRTYRVLRHVLRGEEMDTETYIVSFGTMKRKVELPLKVEQDDGVRIVTGGGREVVMWSEEELEISQVSEIASQAIWLANNEPRELLDRMAHHLIRD